MQRLYRAVRDVSQEATPGLLKEKMRTGNICDYSEEELEKAQEVYKQIVLDDLLLGNYNVEQLKTIRDPMRVTQNLGETEDPFDISAMSKARDESLRDEILKDPNVLFRKEDKS